MVTCFLKYQIDPNMLDEFERYGKLWIDLVNKMGGDHHGYLMPYEGANNVAYASFSFSSLAEYEAYRNKLNVDPDCQSALEEAKESGCIVSHERSFMRPVFNGFRDKARVRSYEWH